MNKITFDEMLRANDLPPVGEIVITPNGLKVEIIGYSFVNELKIHAKFKGVEVDWFPEQVRLCS